MKRLIGILSLAFVVCASSAALAAESESHASTSLLPGGNKCPAQGSIEIQLSQMQPTPNGLVEGLPVRVRHYTGDSIVLDNYDYPFGASANLITTITLRVAAENGTLQFDEGNPAIQLGQIEPGIIGYFFSLGLRDTNGAAIASNEFEGIVRYTTNNGRCSYEHTFFKENLHP